MQQLRAMDPRQLGPYWLAGRLGAGGQGVVYDGTGARVAVKALHLDADSGVADQLRREVRMLERVAVTSWPRRRCAGTATAGSTPTCCTAPPEMDAPDVSFTRDGRQLVLQYWDAVTFVDIDPEVVAANLCAEVGNTITAAQWNAYAPETAFRKPCP